VNESTLTPLESHKISVLRRVKQVVFDVSPDLLLAFEGLGLIEDLECEAEGLTLIEPIIQRNPYSSVVGGVEVPVIAQMPMSQFTGEVKEDTQLTMDVEEPAVKEEFPPLGISVDEPEPPCNRMDEPCMICGSEIYDIESEEFVIGSKCCSSHCTKQCNQRVEAANLINESLAPKAESDEPKPAKLYSCLSCGQPICKMDERICQSCKLQVTERSVMIPKPSGLQGKSIDELIDGQPCLNACYDPAKLVQLALTVVDDPLSLTGSFTQKLLGIEKVSGTSQPMIWARYHGENLSNLRPFERKDYLQALLVRRQVHNRERGAAA